MQLALTANCFDDEQVIMAQQLGVQQIVAEPADWDLDTLSAMRNRVEKAGLELIAIDRLPSALYEQAILGQPGRDEQIAAVCRAITHAGQVGIPMLGYSWTPPGLPLAAREARGRGGALVAVYGCAPSLKGTSEGDRVASEALWSNLRYFLERVIPVAENAGVRLACRPGDPALTRQGASAGILGSVEGLTRLFALAPSAYHGLDLWQGALGVDPLPAIRHFGAAGRIMLVTLNVLQEAEAGLQGAFLDEAPGALFAALRAYRELGYPGPVRAAPPPTMEGDTPWGHKGRALDLGYLRALMQVVERISG